MWERHRSVLRHGVYGLRWNQVDFERASLSYYQVSCRGDVYSEGPLTEHFHVLFQTEGEITHRLNGRDFVASDHGAIVHAPGVDVSADIDHAKTLMLNLEPQFVRAAMERRFHTLAPVETWLATLPHTPRVESLRSTVFWFAGELDRPGSPIAREARLRRHAERLLLGLFIECLSEVAPHDAGGIPALSEAQVRIAEEWIDANLAEPIGVDEIAAAIGIGVRSLQLAFQRARGYSPMRAVARRRLDRARALLLNSQPGATVTSIAAEIGVLELGRFAQRYRERYGETPSQTLARRRGK